MAIHVVGGVRETRHVGWPVLGMLDSYFLLIVTSNLEARETPLHPADGWAKGRNVASTPCACESNRLVSRAHSSFPPIFRTRNRCIGIGSLALRWQMNLIPSFNQRCPRQASEGHCNSCSSSPQWEGGHYQCVLHAQPRRLGKQNSLHFAQGKLTAVANQDAGLPGARCRMLCSREDALPIVVSHWPMARLH